MFFCKSPNLILKIDGQREDGSNTEASDFFTWTDELFSRKFTASNTEIFFSEELQEVLNIAFSKNLSRRVNWDVTQLSPANKKIVKNAARIYKRGVTIHDKFEKNATVEYCPFSEIYFEPSLFNAVLHIPSNYTVIVDKNVESFWWPYLPPHYISFEFSEDQKNFDTVEKMIGILKSDISKDGQIDKINSSHGIAVIGGGVAGDICGFAAGLLQIPWMFLPTTTLSQIDSSIGGKVGVNYEPWGKNQIGLFTLPKAVVICPEWLSSLRKEHFIGGFVEGIKHALLFNDLSLQQRIFKIVSNTNQDLASTENLFSVLKDSIKYKFRVVSQDPFEKSIRVILNLGHTLGHALEQLSLKKKSVVNHGFCVAIGIYHDLRLSKKFCGYHGDSIFRELKSAEFLLTADEIRKHWGNLEEFSDTKNDIITSILGDKKNDGGGRVNFITLNEKRDPYVQGNKFGIFQSPEEAWKDIQETWSEIIS